MIPFQYKYKIHKWKKNSGKAMKSMKAMKAPKVMTGMKKA